jgi:shikimate dehydrogenase
MCSSAFGQKRAIPSQNYILINATSVGLLLIIHEELPPDYGSLSFNMVAVEVIPNPPNTNFLNKAREAGCHSIDGLGMLVEQGRNGGKLWCGTLTDAWVMRNGLEKAPS